MIIDVYNNGTNHILGSITEPNCRWLVDALEEESDKDRITSSSHDHRSDRGWQGTDHLVTLLRTALGRPRVSIFVGTSDALAN